jgi:hypothetical protein
MFRLIKHGQLGTGGSSQHSQRRHRNAVSPNRSYGQRLSIKYWFMYKSEKALNLLASSFIVKVVVHDRYTGPTMTVYFAWEPSREAFSGFLVQVQVGLKGGAVPSHHHL